MRGFLRSVQLGVGVATFLFGRLEAQAQEEEVVVVQGSRAPTDPSQAELSVGSVEGETLRQPGVDAAAVLSRTPGVQVTKTGSSADLMTLSIRGAEASQAPVYLAGIRINDDVVGLADLSRVPLWMMHRVRVYRGATPFDATRGGMAGALVFEPSLPRSPGYRIGAESGSFGTGGLWFGGTMKHLSDDPDSRWVTSVSAKREGARNDFEFESDGGTAFVSTDDEVQKRQNADYAQTDFWALSRGALRAGAGQVRITGLYNHFSREQGVSGLSLVPARAARSSLNRDLAGLSARLPCSWGRACALSAATGLLVTSLETSDPAGELSLGTGLVDQRSRRISQNMGLRLVHTKHIATAWGASTELSQLEVDAEDGALARARETYVGLSSSVKWSPRSDRFVRLVARASCQESEGVDVGRSSSEPGVDAWSQCAPEGRLGLFKQLSSAGSSWGSVRATAHSGVRFPTLGERFGVSATTRGNSDLEVERAFTVDLGGTWEPPQQKWGDFWVDLSVFDRRTKDLIAYRRSALGYVRPFNVGSARFLGAEVSGEVDAFSHVRSRSMLTLLDPRDTSEDRTTTNDLIVYRSQITASEEVEVYRQSSAEVVSYASVSAGGRYRSGRVADPAGLIIIPQQLVFDVGARMQFVKLVDVRARLENLLDSARYDTLGFPLPGRSFFLSAEIVSN